MIGRLLLKNIIEHFYDQKVIVILGPRQAGKTTLLRELEKEMKINALWWNGDEFDIRILFEKPTSSKLINLIGKNKYVIIDEAQRIENIGLSVKLIYDNTKHVKIILSGSSSFELANKINEPLTGRKWEYKLFPLSYKEMSDYHGVQEEKRLLEHRLIFGYYPEVINSKGDEQEVLKQLADSYLYKDILRWENIHKPDKMERLVQALAFQIGHEVSFNELSHITGLDNTTVEKYIDLLEKAFIVFRIKSFKRNLRNELVKSRKIYFYDVGLRNTIIRQFNPVGLRNDVGALWENFLIVERMKQNEYNRLFANTYFWRTHAQQEIDYIEEYGGKLHAYEFKWNSGKKVKTPVSFKEAYPQHEFKVITKENYEEFISTVRG